MPDHFTTAPLVAVPGNGIYSDNGNFTTDGTSGNVTAAGTMAATGAISSSATVTAATGLKTTNGKIGMAGAGDVIDLSAATGKIGVGSTSTKLQFQLAASTNNLQDVNGNQLNSGGAKITGSTNAAVAHNYAGTLTPTLFNTMIGGTATAVAWNTIGTANGTIAMTSAAAYVAQAQLV